MFSKNRSKIISHPLAVMDKHGYRGESKKTGFTISVILGDFFLGCRRVLAGRALEEKGSDSGIGDRPLLSGLLSVQGRIGSEGRGS